jgi:Rrf2 family protein
MFSKACEYAIRAVLYIAIKSVDGSRLGIKEIAKEIDSPEPFTAKILQTLSREGIISSAKGPNGGFYLDPNAKPIPLADIVTAIDKGDILHSCVLGLKACSDEFPCPIHSDIKAYKGRLREVMNKKTVQQLAKDLERGDVFLKNQKGKSRR